jgi:hypothetical protein
VVVAGGRLRGLRRAYRHRTKARPCHPSNRPTRRPSERYHLYEVIVESLALIKRVWRDCRVLCELRDVLTAARLLVVVIAGGRLRGPRNGGGGSTQDKNIPPDPFDRPRATMRTRSPRSKGTVRSTRDWRGARRMPGDTPHGKKSMRRFLLDACGGRVVSCVNWVVEEPHGCPPARWGHSRRTIGRSFITDHTGQRSSMPRPRSQGSAD